MTTPPDSLAALGFAAAHGLDTSLSSEEYVADIRGGEADAQVASPRTTADRRAYWLAYARTTAAGRTSDDLLAEARDPDAMEALPPVTNSPIKQYL